MRKETFGMKKNLGSLLVDQNIITMQVLEEALQRQVIFGGRLGTNLMEMGAVKEETLLKVLASQHNVPFAEKHHFENILQDVIDSVPLELIEQHRIIPLKKERNKIVLAMRDPTRLDVIDEVSFRTDSVVKPAVASELMITQALERYYNLKREARYISVKTTPDPFARAPDTTTDQVHDLEVHELLEEDALTIEDFSKSFMEVSTRDDVAHAVISGSLRILDDVFMFILKGQEAMGWMSGGKLEPAGDFGSWNIVLETHSILNLIQESRSVVRGSGIDLYATNSWLRTLSETPPEEITVCPLVLRKHTVSAIVGFSWDKTLEDEELEYLVRLMRKASIAFEILILKSKILML